MAKVTIAQTEYEVVARKPYPNAKNRICDNVLLIGLDGRGKHWIADYALPAQEGTKDE